VAPAEPPDGILKTSALTESRCRELRSQGQSDAIAERQEGGKVGRGKKGGEKGDGEHAHSG
jgi:hypothetical protein